MTDSNKVCLDHFDPPEIWAERCVHSRIKNASCRACVDACHVGACQLDDQQPVIDPVRCDGCGICAAVCPETAIEHAHSPLSIHWRGELLALIACEKVSGSSFERSDGVISCIHALSMRDLARLYAAGHRRLLFSTASCESCSRGDEDILGIHLNALNSLLAQRGEPLFEHVGIGAKQWSDIIRSSDPDNTGKKISRRHFLRQASCEISDYSLRKFELSSTKQANLTPIAELLFATPDGNALPCVPRINTRRCTACDTCLKLCPHYALTLDEENGTAYYKIDAVVCTGCGICVDVCEDKAIKIERNTAASTHYLELNEGKCQVCGLNFHSFDAKPAPFCQICQKKTHHNQLFQVLD